MVFGRAGGRGLHRVWRVSMNTIKHNKRSAVRQTIYNLSSKIQTEATAVLNKHAFRVVLNIMQKHIRNAPKTFPKVTQNGSFLEPGSHSGTMLLPESQIVHQFDTSRHPKETHLEPNGHPEGQQILKVPSKIIQKHRSKNITRKSHDPGPSQTCKSTVLL